MSDVLSPAEQVRAAQWSANWLGDHGYDSHRLSGGDAVAALRWAVDELDPPETVESLRAERDKALADAAHYKDQFRLVCDEAKSLAVALDAMRDERDEALAEMEEVGAAWRQEQIMHQKAWATIRNLQAELAAALRDNERFEGEQEELVQTLSKLSAANDTIAQLRSTHAEQIEDMKARWLKDARERSTDLFLAKNPLPSSEAARGRCQRED